LDNVLAGGVGLLLLILVAGIFFQTALVPMTWWNVAAAASSIEGLLIREGAVTPAISAALAAELTGRGLDPARASVSGTAGTVYYGGPVDLTVQYAFTYPILEWLGPLVRWANRDIVVVRSVRVYSEVPPP
jgi:hypothetical protein